MNLELLDEIKEHLIANDVKKINPYALIEFARFLEKDRITEVALVYNGSNKESF